MFKLKKRYILLFLFILLISIPINGQDTEEPATEAPTEIITEAAYEAPTEVPTETITEAPVVTEPSEEAPTEAPTDASVVTEEPTAETVVTEETLVTEEPTISPTATEVATELSPIPTEAPVTNIEAAPAGEAVEMLIAYNPNASAESIAEMLRALGAVELERLPQIGVIRALIPSSVANTASARSHLQSNNLASAAGLINIEANSMGSIMFTPNDPQFPNQSEMHDGYSGNEIWMESAWSISPRDGQGVLVAVVDTGVDLQHPEFAGKLVPGWDFYNDDNNPDDDHFHGTHVAGVIAAKTNNGVGIAGMAYNAMILPVKVCNSVGGCPLYETAAGIIYAVDRGAKVINISLGFDNPTTTLEGAINYALSRNVVVVAAAGNDGDNNPLGGYETTDEIKYPAYYPGVISVAAMDTDGNTIADFSNSNNRVTIAAPGVDILSTWPLADYYMASSYIPGYNYISGTSMASPHVAALAAMMIADGIATTPAQVRENLMCTSLDKGTVGYDNLYGYGYIQADLALGYNGNSASCQVSQPNDFIEFATTITGTSFTITQPVNTRSVTESATDPQIAGNTANQTLWYKFTPTTSGEYFFSTLGSSGYDTLLGVYQGMPGSLTEIASNDDNPSSTSSWLHVTLARSVTYYIQAGTFGADVSSQFIRLNMNQGSLLTTAQQENAPFIRYTGSWNRVAQTGASGGYVNTTSDANATMSFLVRGANLTINRLVGPTQGSMNVYLDGSLNGTYSNLGATTRVSAFNMNLDVSDGGWHLVMIKMLDTNLAPLSIDSIQVTNNALLTGIVGATRVSETVATTFGFHNGTWSTVGLTNALNFNALRTSSVGAYIEFRTSGTGVTFWRQTGPSAGTMDVYIDNVLVVDDFDNSALDNYDSVPFSIANLPQRERVVRIEHVGGTSFTFDGAQSVNQTVLASNVITDERSSSLVYSGVWVGSTVPTTVANAGTLSLIASDTDGDVQFMFNGNHFCIGYQSTVLTGTMDVYLDGNYLDSIDTSTPNGNKLEWCTYNPASFNTIPDTQHSVTIKIPAFEEIHLDYIRAVRRQVFTSNTGYIAENNAGLIYTGNWANTTQASLGGARFQGNSALRADANDATVDTVSFNMSGTGFILYTSLPRAANSGGWQVFVNGNPTPLDFEVDGVTNPYIDLWGGWDRFRPIGYGVVDLPPGLHYITISAVQLYSTIEVSPGVFVTVSNPLVDFDGIRILP